MRVVIKAAEDNIMGGFGWLIKSINGVDKFDYSDEFFTAQGDRVGMILAHDILEHALNIEDGNLNELAALGAILAHREQDFYNDYGNDGFASEVAEQLRYYLALNGIDNIQDDTCSSRDWYVNEKYEGYEDEIIEYLEDDLEEEGYDVTPKLCRDIHRLAKSYLAKGYNEVSRKEARYRLRFNYIFEMVKNELDDVCSQYQPEEFYYQDGKITLNIDFNYGVDDARVYNAYQW